MTVDPEQPSGDRERPTRPSSYPYNSSYNSAPPDESPDLLRWRADLLLDEMMLGAVDISAADSAADLGGPGVAGPAAGSPGVITRPAGEPSRPGLESGDPGASRRATYPSPAADAARRDIPGIPDSAPPPDDLPGFGDSTPFDPEPGDGRAVDVEPDREGPDDPYGVGGGYRSILDAARLVLDEPEDDLGSGASRPESPASESLNGGGVDNGGRRNERLYGLEQQYDAYRRNQESTVQPTQPSRPSPSQPPPPVPRPDPPDEQTRWANTPEKWHWQDFSAAPGQSSEPPAPFAFPSTGDESSTESEVGSSVSAMSVVINSKKRSTLLPRMSTLDVDSLNREIAALHSEIGSLLPVGHEASERARHLLDKAYSILQSDPMRSAEVEYYMQQVRTIVQRVRQARLWSDHYRDRLRLYLSSWLVLAFVVFMARYIYQVSIEDAIIRWFSAAADSFAVQNIATLIGVMAAGALGGSAGALYTMRLHTRLDHGLFDRKYGLRGLMLPIIPMIVGAVGYILVAIVYALMGINPALNIVAAALPEVAAFAFGFSQESIYGTRG